MEQVQIPAFSDPLPVPIPLLKEKPRQGVPGKNPAPHPRHDLHNSTIAIGLRAALHLDAVRSRYTGKERDQESGNDYLGARYYSSSMGRFLSPDPSVLDYADPTNPQSLNLYTYGRNNPLINTDPTGLDCVHINNDTGQFVGFESGDCDNSTEASANSGYYVDGTVNSISFNSQSQVIGYGTSTGAEGDFNSFAGSTSPDAGPAAFSLNPYGGPGSTSETINVNGNQSPGPSTTTPSIVTIIPRSGFQPPSNLPVMQATYRTPPPQLKGDPACLGAPDAVSDIHNLERGNAQNGPQAETNGQFGSAIWQNTTQGNKPFGSGPADTGFNAGFMIGDYGLSVVNCLQSH